MRIFYSNDYAAREYSIDATRKHAWVAESLAQNPLSGVRLVEPPAATREQLLLAHDESYVDAVQDGSPSELAESSSFPWDPGAWTAEVATCGGMIAAFHAALDDGMAGNLSCGAHHAVRERGRLHCTFNDLAIAIMVVRQAGVDRVLYIDVDGHCGGGIYSIVGHLSGYRQIDVSVFETDKFKPGENASLDLVKESKDYLPTIQRRLDEMGEELSTYQLAVYYAGMDPHEGSAFGGFPGIDHQMLYDRDKLVLQRLQASTVPCVFALGGGYLGPGLDKQGLVALHRRTIEIAASLVHAS